MAEKQSYPRIPASNWWTLRSQFQKTLPAVMTVSYLKSLLSLTTEKAASNLIPPLKQLGLIDDDCKPTQRAIDWRSDAKYEETCKKMIKEVYPQELLDLYSGSEIDKKGVTDWFMHTAALGAGAASFSASTYIMLNQPLNAFSDEKPKKPKASTNKSKKDNNVKTTKTKNENPIENEVKITPTTPDHQQTSGPNLHIDLQIHISPDATPQQIENIFESIAKHLYKQ